MSDQQQHQAQHQVELVGRRFRLRRDHHPKQRGRIAVVLDVRPSRSTGCGVRLTYRYEDSPPKATRRVSQRWFLESFTPIAETIDGTPVEAQ